MKKLSFKKTKVKNYKLTDYTMQYVSEYVGGFNEGELITIAARPGCGKSTIARNLIINFNHQDIKTLLVSSEETESEIASKIMKTVDSRGWWFDNDIFYLEDEKMDIKTIERNIKASKAKIVFIDYLQQLDGKIKDNTKALKQLALKYKCVIFMLSQLNRCAAGRMPDTSMLSQSDNILHDSDQVWLIHNSELTNSDGDELLIVNVAKNRKGKVGKLWIGFKKDQGKILDMDLSWYKRTWKAYQATIEEKRYPWARDLIEAIDNMPTIKKSDSDKPLMILKSGIII